MLLLSPQNQFFISSLPTEELRNEVPDAIRDRIIEAHNSGQKFRVIVVLPQLPEFAGISLNSHTWLYWELVTYVVAAFACIMVK